MKCQNAGCGFRSLHDEGMRVHLATCSNRTSRRSFNVPVRSNQTIHRRFGGSASRVHCDNVQDLSIQTNLERNTAVSSPEITQGPLTKPPIPQCPKEMKSNALAAVLVDVKRRTGELLVENLLNIMNDEEFDLKMFQGKFKNTSDCVNLVDGSLEQEMSKKGFLKENIRSSCGRLECVLYKRCPIEIIRDQARSASRPMFVASRSVKDHHGRSRYTHPVSAAIGTQAVPEVVSLIKTSSERTVYWRDETSSEGQSFVGLGQLYSDKTQTSLKSSSTSLYPLHLTLLNFQEEDRRRIITTGASIVAFLPVEYISLVGASGGKTFNVSRVQKMKLLHEAIENILMPLKIRAVTGFPLDSAGRNLHCHFVIANYCCDIPEARDMLSLKIGPRSTHGCHRCFVPAEKMSETSTSQLRSIVETKKCRDQAERVVVEGGTKATARKCLDICSLSDYKSFLESFPFVGCHVLLDMHSIFTYEPLHNLLLGISKLLKELISARLSDSTLVSDVLKTKSGDPKSFDTIRSDILNGMNRILCCIQAESPGVGLRIDFSSAGKGSRFNGLFKLDGLIGMLEGADHRSLDQIMPFLAMFVDSCCGNGSETTTVFVLYSEIQLILYGKDSSGWTSSEIENLRALIIKFKREAKNLFGTYQASNMRTPKFHLLDHICFDIERMGGLQYGDASHFEQSHVVVKSMYAGTSKRKRSAMDETVENLSRSVMMKKKKKVSGQKQGARYATYVDNVVSLVRDGARFSFGDLKNTYLYERARLKNAVATGLEANENARRFISDSGMEASRMFMELLKNKYQVNHAHIIMHLKLQRVSSAFVSGGFIPTSKDVKDSRNGIELKFREPELTFSQRIVSTGNFYGSGKLKQDCVLIEADAQSSTSSRTVWVAKVLGLFRVNFMSQSNEIALVQYFDVVHSTSQPMRALGCVNLRWAREEPSENDEHGTSGKWFDIIPAAAIRGVVQVVSIDYPVKNIASEKQWHERTYHINRFFSNAKDYILI